MFHKTLEYVSCPACSGELQHAPSKTDIVNSEVQCKKCKGVYPILAGVLILVEDVEGYIQTHIKGIARYVEAAQIPKKFKKTFQEALAEIEEEHIEEDLEAERVTSLYIMNQYLKASEVHSSSPHVADLVTKYWDKGPFHEIRKMLSAKKGLSLLELGCGVGGLPNALSGSIQSYLGLDSSFASIMLARHFMCGSPIKGAIRCPADLIDGDVSRVLKIKIKHGLDYCDYVICDLASPPLSKKKWDACAALNVIDMLDEPADLVSLQKSVLAENGICIQSSPYIWHRQVARHLRKTTPKDLKSSSDVIRYLYGEQGFKNIKSSEHIPWLFFKNDRQIELYSVHLLMAEI